MRSTSSRKLLVSGCLMALLTGCNPLKPVSATGTAGTTSAPAPAPPSTAAPAPPPSYSVGVSLSRPSFIVGTNGPLPTLVYEATDSGMASPYASLEGCLPAVDGQGYFYMLSFQYPHGCGDFPASIDVYPPNAVGGPSRIRSLPVGSGMKIVSVKDMAVSPVGEIFVNDGNGVAVFSGTANGADAPVRYVQWDGGAGTPVTPGFIAVDGKDNLYVQNGSSIAVFGPKDTGLVVPSRVISGPHTQLAGLGRMTTDVLGNLYVTAEGDIGSDGVAVLEFIANAAGDAVPDRTVSSPKMTNFDGYPGVAVDSSGQIFVRATAPYCGAIFVFAPFSSGSSTPLKVLGGDCPAGDIDGTIAVY